MATRQIPDNEPGNGIVTVQAQRSVNETLTKLEQLLKARAVTVFAIVDHTGEAEKVGLKMPNTKLVIFGDPKAGTPLMLSAPTVAIDLPLKLLVWEDAEAKVWISYNSPEFLRSRHNLPPDLIQALTAAAALADNIAH